MLISDKVANRVVMSSALFREKGVRNGAGPLTPISRGFIGRRQDFVVVKGAKGSEKRAASS